jgi:hypothetical protein
MNESDESVVAKFVENHYWRAPQTKKGGKAFTAV